MTHDQHTPQDTDSVWFRAELMTTQPQITASALWAHHASGVEVRDGETFFEDADWVPVPDGTTRLIAYFEREDIHKLVPLESDLRAWVNQQKDTQLVAITNYTDTSWETAWRDYFLARPLSERAIVGPPWQEFEAPEHGVRIIIDPGMAFGTGTHETTQVVSMLLDDLLAANPNISILDVGCGSAILCILARKLGAMHIEGIDIDAQALANARGNLILNGIDEDSIPLSTTPVEDVPDSFDLVVANILPHILIELESGLKARVRTGGALILSGIIESALPQIHDVFLGEDFTLIDTRQHGEWFALHLIKARSQT